MVISWAKENGLLPSGRALDDGQGLLIISSVKYEDSGTYICTATSGRFIKTSTAVLNVGGNNTGKTKFRARQFHFYFLFVYKIKRYPIEIDNLGLLLSD